jgi:hypothetical protein
MQAPGFRRCSAALFLSSMRATHGTPPAEPLQRFRNGRATPRLDGA